LAVRALGAFASRGQWHADGLIARAANEPNCFASTFRRIVHNLVVEKSDVCFEKTIYRLSDFCIA
jgi:hypothetical protein